MRSSQGGAFFLIYNTQRNKKELSMQPNSINEIVIVGGGTAGWMTAAALSKFLPANYCKITLIESEQIGTVGVGEATIPHIRHFNDMLGIDENEFIRATQATYKLGIQFINWGAKGSTYIHPFGLLGHDINGIDFHHYWLRLRELGDTTPIDDYAIANIAALAEKFDYPNHNPNEINSEFGYAFHMDASLYAIFLKKYSMQKGVIRVEGKINHVALSNRSDSNRSDSNRSDSNRSDSNRSDSNTQGFVESVTLESGQSIAGQLFIDCSGFRGLLIEEALATGYEDWSHWLPCDRAVAIPSEKNSAPLPYTRAIAQDVGWQWRIPLQHRTGNGQVYCSNYMSDETAEHNLRSQLEGKAMAEPNFLRFKTGRRKQSWNKNCVAIGLASGFLEPLESTSIYLIQVGINKLLELFPTNEFAPADTREFNRLIDIEYRRVRDFLILHYKANSRYGLPFWDYCRNMPIPSELDYKMQLFRECAQVEHYEQGLFMAPSWQAVYFGQGIIPQGYDTRITHYPAKLIAEYLQKVKQDIHNAVELMPSHSSSINRALKTLHSHYPTASMSLYGSKK
jgi:tryptophan 7-halogenase